MEVAYIGRGVSEKYMKSTSGMLEVSIRERSVQWLTVLHQIQGMYKEDKVGPSCPLVSGSLGTGSGNN